MAELKMGFDRERHVYLVRCSKISRYALLASKITDHGRFGSDKLVSPGAARPPL
jgi:hypothetical protein